MGLAAISVAEIVRVTTASPTATPRAAVIAPATVRLRIRIRPFASVPWYEARRGEIIAPRFYIPDRFDSRYPIGFEAESVAHYRDFCTGGASAGREAEANALFTSAAYLTEVSNALGGTVRGLRAIGARIPSSLLEWLRDCRWEVSDAQLALFVFYELTASRYEILCGRQGARGVADPALSTPPSGKASQADRPFRGSRNRRSGTLRELREGEISPMARDTIVRQLELELSVEAARVRTRHSTAPVIATVEAVAVGDVTVPKHSEINYK
jgi:hypothetical protein